TSHHRLAFATKGLDSTGIFLSEVFAQEYGAPLPLAVIAGPNFAKEVAQALPAACVIASIDKTFQRSLAERFAQSNLRPYFTQDVRGVQWCGVAKNVLAIAVGIADGMKLGANARAALITRGLHEMLRLTLL